jgi:hypothetical protein
LSLYLRYKKTCRLPASSLWDMPTDFFDLYVPFTLNEDLKEQELEREMMYSVFNLVSIGGCWLESIYCSCIPYIQ